MTTAPEYVLARAAPPAYVVPVLDPAQQHVVNHGSGPLLVLAGPGTGKTTTLVEAVAERIARDRTDPDRVLVLTFGRKAADELRERIALRLGRTVREPAAFTFHSWCYALLRAWTPAGQREPRVLSGAERDVRIRDLLTGNADDEGTTRWPDGLRHSLTLRGFASEVADLLDRARERGLDGATLRARGEQHGRVEWISGGTFLDEYLDVLNAAGELDYADLVRQATQLLDDPTIGARVRGQYDAVFVDEYQDTDPSQERLLHALVPRGGDLVVVGDPDQAIYAFRGADISGILEFPTRFPTREGASAPVIALRRSRRAGRALLDASRRVAARLPTPGLAADNVKQHRALDTDQPDGSIAVALFPTLTDEVSAIADLLRRAHLVDGLPWSQMAVLVRSGRRTIPVLRRAFAAAGVPVSVATDEVAVANDPAVAPLLMALGVAARTRTLSVDESYTLLLSPLGRATPSGLRRLGRALRGEEREAGVAYPPPSSTLVARAIADARDLTLVEDPVGEPVRRLARLVTRARRILDAGGGAEEALWEIWDGSGWSRRLERESIAGGPAGRAADRDLDAVCALFAAVARFEDRRPRAGVRNLIEELAAQQIPSAAYEEGARATDAVRLLTAHRAKGLEWDLVVVAGVQEGTWPDLRRRGSLLDADLVDYAIPRPPVTPGSLLVEERRLFYVALTRARQRCVVTAVSAQDDEGDRPSRFLLDVVEVLPPVSAGAPALLTSASLAARLRRTLLDPAASRALRDAAARELALLAPQVAAADPDTWWGVRGLTEGIRPVRDPALPVRLSPSAVASYETCPRRWFLERESRAQAEATTNQGFGKVIHALAQQVTEGVLPADVPTLLAQLDAVWGALGFAAPWHAAYEREEAEAALAAFVSWHGKSNRGYVRGGEVSFEVTVGDVQLVGRVDRLEVIRGAEILVIDYKTGKSKMSKERLSRDPQLGLYQLAAREGGFAEKLGAGRFEVGGAQLWQLRARGVSAEPHVQPQEPIGSDRWVDDVLASTAAGIRAESFPAIRNEYCRMCSVVDSCPAAPAGAQVVE